MDQPAPEDAPGGAGRITSSLLVGLGDADAMRSDLVGNKAAALARAVHAGLPVPPGVVLTTAFVAELDATGGRLSEGGDLIGEVIARLGPEPLAVRSSSTVEDEAGSSMAGRFESVVGVRGRDELAEAVATVMASRRQAARGAEVSADAGLAVLIQPVVDHAIGGVAFGVDPVTGREDRRLVVASVDGPGAVVEGEGAGRTFLLDPDGRVVEIEGDDAATLSRHRRRALVGLLAAVAKVLDGPQDIEWVIDDDDALHLLQSRAVTTPVRGRPVGPVYDIGPVSETFPTPLRPLEVDLWVPPLRAGLESALTLSGAASPRRLRDRPLVVAPSGRVAVDAEITSGHGRRGPVGAVARRLRRVRHAWRVGRMRRALPAMAVDTVVEVDRRLESVPALDELSDRQLVALLDGAARLLAPLHAHEILMGRLLRDAPALTGGSVALRTLVAARRIGLDDAEVIARSPSVLALTAPSVCDPPRLPRRLPPLAPARPPGGVAVDDADATREALRMRVRWIHELTARVVLTLAGRLIDEGAVGSVEAVAGLGLDDLRHIVAARSVPLALDPDLDDGHETVATVPARFRLSDRGLPIPEIERGTDGGVGASPGCARGPVTRDTESPPSGSVLVVDRLRPELAPLLDDLAGLIAGTGSPLAHLAILARETGVPAVVGHADLDRLVDGSVVEVDGDRGRVRRIETPGSSHRGERS